MGKHQTTQVPYTIGGEIRYALVTTESFLRWEAEKGKDAYSRLLTDLSVCHTGTFKELGKKYEICYERVRQLLKKHFNRTGRERRKVCTLANVSQRINYGERIWAMDRITAQGFVVKPVIHKSRRVYRGQQREVVINGKKWRILFARKTYFTNKASKQKYYHSGATNTKGENCLIITGEDENRQLFIVPNLPTLNWAIPENGYSNYHGKKPTIDWFQYKDAWKNLGDNL